MADEYGGDNWDPQYWGGGDSGGGDSYPAPNELPSGSGAYSVGGSDWQGIYAPGGDQGGYLYDANAIYGPSDYSMVAGRGDPSAKLMDDWNANPSLGIPSGAGYGDYNPSGRPGGGYVQQPFQRIGLGTPERTLYDRYSSMLLNPEQMTGDPAYQFLFNQGQQALNRSLAAKRMTYSGKALNDTMAYGQGMASDYFKRMIPQYQGGAQEELRRFMGPAGLLPTYAGINNRASESEGSAAAARELMPLYMQGMGGGGYGGGSLQPTPNIGYGGVNSGYSAPRLDPRTLSTVGSGDNEDILTALEGMGYGDY